MLSEPTVTPVPRTFEQYKQRRPRRQDRVYNDVIVTGLDNDEARWEVQRDLPRILIDGATGRDMKTPGRASRVRSVRLFGLYEAIADQRCRRRREL